MLFQVDDFALIEIKGVDAEQFLQGQMTCDVKKMSATQTIFSAHCDPKGKVHSVFYLYRQNAECFYALVAQDLAQSTLQGLKKYAVFSKVTLSLAPWSLYFSQDASQIDETCMQIEIAPNCHIFFAENLHLDYPLAPKFFLQYSALKAGIPLLSCLNQDKFIPQALNLDKIPNTISFTKGCYIGQETVARAKYRGINKRAMFTFSAPLNTPFEIGAEINLNLAGNLRPTGCILSAISQENRLFLQVILNQENAQEGQFSLHGENLTLLF